MGWEPGMKQATAHELGNHPCPPYKGGELKILNLSNGDKGMMKTYEPEVKKKVPSIERPHEIPLTGSRISSPLHVITVPSRLQTWPE